MRPPRPRKLNDDAQSYIAGYAGAQLGARWPACHSGSSSCPVCEITVNHGPQLRNSPFEKILSFEIRCDARLLLMPGGRPAGRARRVSLGRTWPWAWRAVLTTRRQRRRFDVNPSRRLLVTAELPCPASRVGGRADVVPVRRASLPQSFRVRAKNEVLCSQRHRPHVRPCLGRATPGVQPGAAAGCPPADG